MPHSQAAPEPLRLAEALAALSLAGDLGMGFPFEHALRVTSVAGRLAEALGLSGRERSNVFYVALLHGIGCTVDAHDLTRVFATDEIALKNAGAFVDEADALANLRFVVAHAGSAGSTFGRPLAIARALRSGGSAFARGLRAHCEVGGLLAARVGVPGDARDGLLALFERWDGAGLRGLRGLDIPQAARILAVAKRAVIHLDHFGPAAAGPAVRAGIGTALEPRIAEAFLDLVGPAQLLEGLGDLDLGARVLDLEPAEARVALPAERREAVFEAAADIADMKSPVFVGGSRAVRTLAVEAGRRVGLAASELDVLGRAALARDLGRAGVPNTILDKPGPLSSADWEVVRLHAYRAERILSRCHAFAAEAAVAGLHHERLDGSGYHRGAAAVQLSPPVRVLAAADAYGALVSERPYRPARSPAAAASVLREDVRAGRLDRDAAEAVIGAGQGLPRSPRAGPSGRLSAREIEVLELLAAGLSTRQAAARLSIAEKTVRHHVEHVYDKLGVSTRAGAVVVALGQGLIGRAAEPRRGGAEPARTK